MANAQIPFNRSKIGQVAHGADIYTVQLNDTTDIEGYFLVVEGGIRVSKQADMQDFMVDGIVQMVSYQNPQVTISIDCIYAVGGTTAVTTEQTANMRKALGINGNFKWNLEVGDKWKWNVHKQASPRGNVADDKSIPDFLDQPLFLESGSSLQIPQSEKWQMSLQFKIYKDSLVMDSRKVNSLTGALLDT